MSCMSDFLILCPVLSPAGDHDITTLVTDWSVVMSCMSDFLILCPVLLPSPAGDHDITTLVTDWSVHGMS